MAQMNASDRGCDVIVVGGGIAGLAAAYSLVGQGHSVVLLEEQASLGGRAITTTVDGVPVDLGAAFVSDFYSETMRLIEELGIGSTLVRRSQTAYVIRHCRPQAIWPASKLIEESALPLLGKLRLAGLLPTLIRHWRNLDISDLNKISHTDRRSAAEYARKTIGAKDTEFFFAPLLRGLLYWDPDTTSAAVVWCILKAFLGNKATYRFSGGMRDLVNALASSINVMCESSVTNISRANDGGFTIQVSVGGRRSAFSSKAVVCAVPAPVAVRVLEPLPSDLRLFLESVSYSSTAVLTYRAKTDAHTYPRGAYLFPSSSVTDLSSVNALYNYVDREQPGADDHSVRLLNVHLSDQGTRDYARLSDAELGEAVVKRLAEILEGPQWSREAELAYVHHWQWAIPRFDVGHIKAMQEFLSQQPSLTPGLAFAGDYIGGPYIDGAIRSGINAARDVHVYLS